MSFPARILIALALAGLLAGCSYEERYEPRNGDPRHDEPRAMCLPAGFPSGMLYI